MLLILFTVMYQVDKDITHEEKTYVSTLTLSIILLAFSVLWLLVLAG